MRLRSFAPQNLAGVKEANDRLAWQGSTEATVLVRMPRIS